MSFSSKNSQKRAETSVNKLFAGLLPQIDVSLAKNTARASKGSQAEQLAHQLAPQQDLARILKHQRLKKNQRLKKKKADQQKYDKLVKYTIARLKRDNLTEEEQKLLRKLVKGNLRTINRLGEYEDPEIEDETEELEEELIRELGPKELTRKVKKTLVSHHLKRKTAVDQLFEAKMARGEVAAPGLTPGLAPVDYESSDEEDE